MPLFVSAALVWRRVWPLLLLGCAMAGPWARAADAPRRTFDLPAGQAEPSLKRFSLHAGVQLVFDSRLVEGVRVNAVRGNLTPLEALDRLLEGTPLRARRDARSGIVSIERANGPEAKKKWPPP